MCLILSLGGGQLVVANSPNCFGLPRVLVLALTAIAVPNKTRSFQVLVFFKNKVDNSAARLGGLFYTKAVYKILDVFWAEAVSV